MDVEAKLERGRALKVRNVAPLPHAAPLSPNLVAYALSLSLSGRGKAAVRAGPLQGGGGQLP